MPPCARTTVRAAMFTMALTSLPRWRTLTGLRMPSRIGADQLRPAERAHQLVGHVACSQVREDQHVGVLLQLREGEELLPQRRVRAVFHSSPRPP